VATPYSEAGPVRRTVRQVVTRGPVAALSARLLPGLDRLAVRVTGGRATLSGWVTGLPIVELATTGARTGERRVHRVMGIPTERGYLVVAANFGRARDPAWVHNQRADVRVEVDGEPHVGRELAGAEREAAFARALELNPGWRRFRQRAGRPIPVVELSPEAQR
jgi:deazaflavin-dependent oxidoreductase (nitroreductase family)